MKGARIHVSEAAPRPRIKSNTVSFINLLLQMKERKQTLLIR